jgi:hypothetical protein
MVIYIGIDGGLNGAIVCINETGNILVKRIMPIIKGKGRSEYDIPEIIKIFNELKSTNIELIAGLEKAQVSPIISKNSAFSMGYCNGMFQGILSALNIPFRIFRAAEWQKEILAGINGTDTKMRSIMWCERRFSNESWKATGRCINDSDGLTDACCIAFYTKLKEGK